MIAVAEAASSSSAKTISSASRFRIVAQMSSFASASTSEIGSYRTQGLGSISPTGTKHSPANGSSILSEPSLLTNSTTSTMSGGVVVTNNPANPTGLLLSSGNSQENSGFFANRGAAAGVFVVGSILVALLVLCLLYVLRSRRRHRHRKAPKRKWISAPVPSADSDSFYDPRASCPVRAISVRSDDIRWSMPHTFMSDEGMREVEAMHQSYNDLKRVPVQVLVEGSRLGERPVYNGPFSRYHEVLDRAQSSTGMLTTIDDMLQNLHHGPESIAMSSPSLYPISEADTESFSGHDEEAQHSLDFRGIDPPALALCPSRHFRASGPLLSPVSEEFTNSSSGYSLDFHDTDPPAVAMCPARHFNASMSADRDMPQTASTLYRPLTPPSSASSHSHSDCSPPRPDSDRPQYVNSLFLHKSIDNHPELPARPQRSMRRLLRSQG